MTTVAGLSCAGSATDMLRYPHGIFVMVNFDLYVADSGNDRIQLFRSGETTARTVVGNGTSGTINLNWPTVVVLDADGYLFIVDHGNHRIIGSGPGGYRCVGGCSGSRGAASNQLSNPVALSFDSYGNLFALDRDNRRIQKFLVSNNSCGM